MGEGHSLGGAVGTCLAALDDVKDQVGETDRSRDQAKQRDVIARQPVECEVEDDADAHADQAAAQLSTWIYAITRNASISAMRKRCRTLSMSDPAVQDEVESRGALPAAEPEDATLWRQVEALPDKQRQAVTLYYQEQRSVEEVAVMMGLPVNTVKTHLHRARASLAAALRIAGMEVV